MAFKGTDNKDTECYNDDYDEIPCIQKPGKDLVSGGGRLNAFSAVSAFELQLKVNTLKDNQNTITGTAKIGSDIEVKIGKEKFTAKADTKGKFTIKIKKVQSAGTLLYVTGSNKGQVAETSQKIIVEKGTPPSEPKVNDVSNLSTAVKGKTVEGYQVKIKDKSKKVIASGPAKSKGNFDIKIKKQKAGTVLYVTTTDLAKRESKAVKIVVKDQIPPKAPKVNDASNKSTDVTGKTVAKLEVKIKNKSKKVIASGTANSKGDFKIKIKKQKAGTTLYVTTTNLEKKESEATKIVVKDKIPPKAPKVNAVTTNDTVIKGKTEALATVTVKHKDKKVGSKKANSKGEYSVKIKKQKANTALHITAKDKAGNTSKATKVTVKKYKKK